jgi:hypothetical protein
MPQTLLGVDFTSAPRPKKTITCAWATLTSDSLTLVSFAACNSFDAFHQELLSRDDWLGAFDLPFGLPREFVAEQGWPSSWRGYTKSAFALTRSELVARCRAYAAVRPAGEKLAYRATDKPAQSSSAMWWMNPPVVLMFHAGVPALLRAGVSIEPCAPRKSSRVAVEAYPGLIQKRLKIGSYKQDVVAKQTDAQRENRAALLRAVGVAVSHWLGVKARISAKQKNAMLDDATGDYLDAWLCVVQAAYAAKHKRFGFPPRVPRNEGWIVMA